MNKPGGFNYEVGQVVGAVSARVEGKQTQPPSRYTQDTLIDDMLGAHKFARNEAERDILKRTEGLGTSRTRETVITQLIRRDFLTSKKKGKSHQIVSTEAARTMIRALPPTLTDVVTTAKWEVALGMIERGEVAPQAFMDKLHAYVRMVVEEAKGKVGAGISIALKQPPAKPAAANHSMGTSRGSYTGAKSR